MYCKKHSNVVITSSKLHNKMNASLVDRSSILIVWTPEGRDQEAGRRATVRWLFDPGSLSPPAVRPYAPPRGTLALHVQSVSQACRRLVKLTWERRSNAGHADPRNDESTVAHLSSIFKIIQAN